MNRRDDFETLDPEFDSESDFDSTLKELKVERCMACYFHDCRCRSGLRDKNLFDDPTEEGYDE